MAEEKQTDKAEDAREKPEGLTAETSEKKKAAGADASEGATEAGGEAAPKKARVRGSKAVPVGVAHVQATFNNTIVSITDPSGAVIAWSSSGRAGFKGSRKSTTFAATVVGQDVARQAIARGMHEVEVRILGAGSGRESAVRALQSSGLTVSGIKDVTPIPHNGCRARKRRRV